MASKLITAIALGAAVFFAAAPADARHGGRGGGGAFAGGGGFSGGGRIGGGARFSGGGVKFRGGSRFGGVRASGVPRFSGGGPRIRGGFKRDGGFATGRRGPRFGGSPVVRYRSGAHFGKHRRRHRGIRYYGYGLPVYYYSDYAYGYVDDECSYLWRRYLRTGHPKWKYRYYDCIDY